jgi:hypothetical protein
MNTLQTGDLDFVTIKDNLKQFLSSQSELQDYNFDGSALSTLLDVLAYNTHYNGLYTNMAVNEMFIDSASKRSSIVSIARMLGYVPHSVVSAVATISLQVLSANDTNTLTLPRGTVFGTENNGTTYSFNLLQDVTVAKTSPGVFNFPSIQISEGTLASITYVKNNSTRFVIPEPNVDITTLQVLVNGVDIYNADKSMLLLNSLSKAYFLKQTDNSLYEVVFGDGTFGVALNNGDSIQFSYLISSGSVGNFMSLFTYSGGANSSNTYSATTLVASNGGAAAEDKESVRHFAPMYYQAQGRAVTTADYAAIVSETYPEIETLSVWGGQDNIPPQYGKVFIAAKPTGAESFSVAEKRAMRQGIVNARGVITVTPEFVDPRYIDIEVTAGVYYDPAKMVRAPGLLETDVRAAIASMNSDLAKFNVPYRHSALTANMLALDPSIVSVINSIRVRVAQTPIFNQSTNYSTDFKNPIARDQDSVFWTTRFYIDDYSDRGYFRNIGEDIYFYTEDVNGISTQQRKYGTLDYAGSITLSNFTVTGLYDDTFEFVYYPVSYDIIPPNGYIIRLPSNHVKINMIADSLDMSRMNKVDHIFTPSR